MPDFDLLVIGEINPDLIMLGESVTPEFGQAEKLVDAASLTIGSSSVIMACGAARLGLRTAFIGIVGDDIFGEFMLASMRDRGIDTSGCIVDPHLQTGFSLILVKPGGDRAILTYPGSIAALRRDHIDSEIINRSRHLHVGSYFLLDSIQPDLPKIFDEAQRKGLTTSLDTNWDPSGRWAVADILPKCDVFFPNEAEVARITGQQDLAAGMDLLAGQIPTLAVKQGAQGGLARQGATTASAPSLDVEVVDTVGAGDSFDAGFLYGYLNDYPLQDALRLACACGSLSTRAAGGTDAQPTLQEAAEHGVELISDG